MAGPWFLSPPLWISDLALLLVVAGLAWLGHALAWRLAGDHGVHPRWRSYRMPTCLAVIAVALLAVPATTGAAAVGTVPWGHLALLTLIAACGWAMHVALGGGVLVIAAVGLAALAAALATFPVVGGLSHVLLACAGVLVLVLLAALGRRVG